MSWTKIVYWFSLGLIVGATTYKLWGPPPPPIIELELVPFITAPIQPQPTTRV